MKTKLLAVAVSLGLISGLWAGETYSGKEVRETTSPALPDPCPDWAGFYFGGFVGYKHGDIGSGLDLGGLWSDTVAEFVEDNARQGLDDGGFEIGGLLGYNFQWNRWVVGLEATGAYIWLDESSFTGRFTGPGGFYEVTSSLESNYLFTFGPRLGHAFCRWLPYVTGGLAVGNLDFDQEFVSSDFFGTLEEGRNETNAGFFVGGGLQYAIDDHWSVRVQYQYVDLGKVKFTYDTINNDLITQGKADLTEHNVSLAVIYQF